MFTKVFSREDTQNTKKIVELVKKKGTSIAGKKVVAIASSTGGPKSLQSVIPRLPENLDAPVLLVQHMPMGFTKSMAERLDSLSEISVCEAVEGEVLENHTYVTAPAGSAITFPESTAGRYPAEAGNTWIITNDALASAMYAYNAYSSEDSPFSQPDNAYHWCQRMNYSLTDSFTMASEIVTVGNRYEQAYALMEQKAAELGL